MTTTPERPSWLKGKPKLTGFRWMKSLGAWRFMGQYYYPEDPDFEYVDWLAKITGRSK